MKGKELIEVIKKNGWKNSDIFVEAEGYYSQLEHIEPLYPELTGTNSIILKDNTGDDGGTFFRKMYYETYINTIFEYAADNDIDELDFFMDLVDVGITLDYISMHAPEYYEYSKKFMEEHGLI